MTKLKLIWDNDYNRTASVITVTEIEPEPVPQKKVHFYRTPEGRIMQGLKNRRHSIKKHIVSTSLLSILLLMMAAGSGCASVGYDDHKSKEVWYWSKQAKIQREIAHQTTEWSKTNQVEQERLQQIKGTNGKP